MRLYFAGGESWSELLLSMGVKNQLLSYYYFRQQLRDGGLKARRLLARMRAAQEKGYSFMLDSGAFTYQTRQGQGLPVPPLHRFFAEYKRFIKDNGDLFDVVVELDVDGVPGANGKPTEVAQVDAWTNELLEIPGMARRIMPVYHADTRGTNWLQDWLLDTTSPLIGYASANVGGAGQFIAQCHRFGKYVHGFAQTRIKTDMKYTLFDSVDSTTWLRADKYGGTCIFRNGKFIVLDHLHKKDRRIYRSYFESWGLSWAKIKVDDLHEMRKATIIAWRELSNSLEAQWHIRTGGKHPYLFGLHAAGQVPKEHPIVTKAKRDAKKRE